MQQFSAISSRFCSESNSSERPKVTLLNDTSCFHHGSQLVVEQIREHCKKHGLNLWHTVRLGEDWRAKRHRERLAGSDIVLVNGEGSLHHGRRLSLAKSAQFCRERNIPCFLINSTYQCNGQSMADFIRQFTLVFVRESRSQMELRNVGIESDVVPDMILACTDLLQAARNGVFVTDSSSGTANVQLHEFYTRTSSRFVSLFKPISTPQAVRMLTARMIGRYAPNRWHWERRSRSYACPQRPFDVASTTSQLRELYRTISSSSLIITGRFHMACLAMLARTPFIALEANTHKIEGLMSDANLSHRYLSSLPNGDRDLLGWSQWRDDELASIEAYLRKSRSKISFMFSRISQAANLLAAYAVIKKLIGIAIVLLPELS